MAGDYGQIARNMRTQVASANFSGVYPSFMLYLGLAFIALLKDLLDLVGLGSLPGIGTVVTICFSFLIWILMTVFDRSGGKSNKKIARSLVFLFASLVEAIGFGLNFLPIETLTVIALYMMARSAAKKEEKRLRKKAAEERGAQEQQAQRVRMHAAQQAAAEQQEAANDARYQGEEAANDREYYNQPVRRVV